MRCRNRAVREQRGEDQETVPEATPGRIVRHDRCDLGESEDEDEIEVELERGDRVLALGGRFDHSRTLARRIV